MASKCIKGKRSKATKGVLPAVRTSPENTEPSLRVSSRVRNVRRDVAALLPSFANFVPGNASGSHPAESEHEAHGSRPDELADDSYIPSNATDCENSDEGDEEELLEQRKRSNEEASINPGLGWSELELRQMAADKPLSHNQGTDKNYKSYINKFTWWCKNDPVTQRARAEPINSNICPPDGPAVAGRFLQWFILDEAEGYMGKPRTVRKSDSAFKGSHAALQALYDAGQLLAKASNPDLAFQPKLTADAGYKDIYRRCQDKFKMKRGEPLPEGVGPHDNTEQSTFSLDDFVKIAEYMVNNPNPLVARDWSMLATMCFTCGRGDDARERFLAELTEPKHRRSIAPCFVTGYVQHVGKTLGSKRAVRGSLRSKDPLLCNQGAMARHLITRFTVKGERFPTDPFDPAWRTLKLWPSSQDPNTAMSYKNHGDRQKDVYTEVGIAPYKVTHAGRIFAARLADEAGLDEQAINRFGLWGNLTSAQLSYLLTGLKPATLLAMGFWDGAAQNDFDVYWHERFMVLVPGELINYLFPFLDELSANIRKASDEGKAVPIYVTNVEQRLQYDAYVAVQDALELVDRTPKNPVHAMLLKHPTFRNMKVEYDASKACGRFESGRPMTFREMMRHVMKTQQQQQHQLGWKQQVAAVPAGQPWQLTGLPQCWQNNELEAPLSQEQELAATLLELRRHASEQEGHLQQQNEQQQQQGMLGLEDAQLTGIAPQGQEVQQLDSEGVAAGARGRRGRAGRHNQHQRQEQPHLGPSDGEVGATDDEVQLLSIVEYPQDLECETKAAAADTFYTPSGGLRKRASFAGRTQGSPRKKQLTWWDHMQHGQQQQAQLALPLPPPQPHMQQEQQVALNPSSGQQPLGPVQQELPGEGVDQLLLHQQQHQRGNQQHNHLQQGNQQQVGRASSNQQQQAMVMTSHNTMLQLQQMGGASSNHLQQMGGASSNQLQQVGGASSNQLHQMGGASSNQLHHMMTMMTDLRQQLSQIQQAQQAQQAQQMQMQWWPGMPPTLQQQMQSCPGMPTAVLGVSNNPFLSMLHPNISSNPQLAASLGLAGGPTQPNEGNDSLALVRYFAHQVAVSLANLPQGGTAGAALQQQQLQQGSRADGADTGAAVLPVATTAVRPGARALGQAGRCFPALSTFPTFVSLWEWYVKPMPGHDKSAQTYEASNDTSWRHGKRQRWAEVKALLDVIEKRAVTASTLRGRVVDQVTAAAELDVEWKASANAGRNLSSYFRTQLKSKDLPTVGPLDGAGPSSDTNPSVAGGSTADPVREGGGVMAIGPPGGGGDNIAAAAAVGGTGGGRGDMAAAGAAGGTGGLEDTAAAGAGPGKSGRGRLATRKGSSGASTQGVHGLGEGEVAASPGQLQLGRQCNKRRVTGGAQETHADDVMAGNAPSKQQGKRQKQQQQRKRTPAEQFAAAFPVQAAEVRADRSRARIASASSKPMQ